SHVFLPIVFPQKVFFSQYLPVEQPYGAGQIGQEYPVGEDQELAKHDDRESHINGIPRYCEDSCRDELARVVRVDADAEAPAERAEAEQEQHQTRSAEEYPGPG